MISQRCDVVRCSRCTETKLGGVVFYEENDPLNNYAVCDDCNGKEENNG